MEQKERKHFGPISHDATASYDSYVLWFDELHATAIVQSSTQAFQSATLRLQTSFARKTARPCHAQA